MRRSILWAVAIALLLPGALPALPELIAAIRRRDVVAVDQLLRGGANSNLTAGPDWRSPLEEAALRACDLRDAPARGPGDPYASGPKILELLIAAGGRVNALPRSSTSSLGLAIESQNQECVKVLLAAGANVNWRDERGFTELIKAASRGGTDLVTFKLLLDAGAEVNARVVQPRDHHYDPSLEGMTALHWVAGGAGSRPDRLDSLLNTATLLITYGADVNARNELGETPLMRAASRATVDFVQLLIQFGAELNGTDKSGNDIYWHARRNSQPDAVLASIDRAMGKSSAIVDGGWNYIYDPGTRQCKTTIESRITVEQLMRGGCSVLNSDLRGNSVLVLNCRSYPDLRDFVLFARTMEACVWISSNYPHQQ